MLTSADAWMHPLLLAAKRLASSQHTLTYADAWMHPLVLAAKRSASRFALAALHSSCSRCAAVAAGAQQLQQVRSTAVSVREDSYWQMELLSLGRRIKRLKFFVSAKCPGRDT
jgi:hypothetical protein